MYFVDKLVSCFWPFDFYVQDTSDAEEERCDGHVVHVVAGDDQSRYASVPVCEGEPTISPHILLVNDTSCAFISLSQSL